MVREKRSIAGNIEEIMEVEHLQKELLDFKWSLFREGILDDQYKVLESLQLNAPGFVYETMSAYFISSEEIINKISNALMDQRTTNFDELYEILFRLRGSTTCTGARRVLNASVALQNFCKLKNREGCVRSLEQLKHENSLLKSKLDTLFALERQIVNASGMASSSKRPASKRI